MDFDEAIEAGQLDQARGILDGWATDPAAEDFELREGYGELAREFDRAGREDDAIAAMELAIEHGWQSAPDPRSDIAEFHLRAGRAEQAAGIWALLRDETPDDVWLFNAAGLSYRAVGDDEVAVNWLGEGLEVAMRTGDPEGLVAQLSDLRRDCLKKLGRDHDELEQRVDTFLETWRDPTPTEGRSALLERIEADRRTDDAGPLTGSAESGAAIAITWFPPGEYEAALERWPDLAETWSDVPHAVYSRRMDGHIKWGRRYGVMVSAVAPIVVDEYITWCEENDRDPEQARASYAVERLSRGEVIWWPPGRNAPCWCGSGRKYKKCCGPAPAEPMHDDET